MTRPGTTIGIDLGTTNSVAAHWDGDTARVISARQHRGLFPSILGWKQGVGDQASHEVVGWEALHNWRFAPRDTVFCVKRLMGRWHQEELVQKTREQFAYEIVAGENGLAAVQMAGKPLTPPEVSARFLAKLRHRAAEELKDEVTSAVITVPAYFEERQRAATREAGRLAGLHVKQVIDEPTAAAIAFGMDEAEGRQTLLVFDLGGGTFDISIMQLTRNQATGEMMFHVNKIDGDNWLGGTDFDQRIIEHVLDHFQREHQVDPRHDPHFMIDVRQEAERCKIELSEQTEVRFAIPGGYRTDDRVYRLDLPLERITFERLIEPELRRVMDAVERAMKRQSVRADDITAVLLVGGASRTPAVRKRLEDRFGKQKIRAEIDPMTVVARGAAILAGKIQGIECPNRECGTTREVEHAKTGKIISIREPTVNDEDAETCDACGTSLAAGRLAVDGTSVSEPTTGSLGIITYKPGDPNAFEPIIPDGTRYPLQEPVRRIFYPTARSTNQLRVPVYEARDNEGTGRWQQGVVNYPLEEAVTRSTPIEVAFNLDRNRMVTVTVRIPDRGDQGVIHQLDHKEPPDELQRPQPNQLPWNDRYMNMIRAVATMVQLYKEFLEPPVVQEESIREHLRDAERLLEELEKESRSSPSEEARRSMALLERDLWESGVATQLMLADLTIQSVDANTRLRLEAVKDKIIKAYREKDREKVEELIKELETLIGELSSQLQQQSKEGRLEFEPSELLTPDKR